MGNKGSINTNENKKKNIENNFEINPEYLSDSIFLDALPIISEQSKNICKIIKENGENGTGFLCKIPFPDSLHLLPVLITCFHVLGNNDILEGKKIKMTFNNDENTKIIVIEPDRKTYFSDENEYDITIIEIKQSDGFNINTFLSIDDYLYNGDISDNYKKFKNIYLIHYPLGFKCKISFGTIKNINLENFELQHINATSKGSSGCPIFNIVNYKIMGIHKGDHKRFEWKLGTVLKGAIDDFINKNEIILNLEIYGWDLNKKIYFLDNTDYIDKDTGKKHFHDNLKELSQYNVKMYIIFQNEEKEYKYNKFFIPNNEGKYIIRLRFKKRIKDCSHMFNCCNNITSINLSSFDTKNVTNMSYMFYNCKRLEELDLSSFDTRKVTNMSHMFHMDSMHCEDCSLKKINLLSFNTENVTDMSYMFYNCFYLKKLDLSNFDTKNTIDMSYMFYNCCYLEKLVLSNFDTINVKNMSFMFFDCNTLKKINLSSFNTSNVINLSHIFHYCYNLTKINLSSFDTKNVIDMSYMFSDCYNLKDIIFSSLFNTKNVTNMKSMFSHCRNLIKIKDLQYFDTNKVLNMGYMFSDCYNLEEIDLSSFNAKKITDLSGMFCGCNNIKILDFTSFDTKNVTDMNLMFCDCEKLEEINLLSFNTQNVVDMNKMFYNCKSLKKLNLSNFNTQNVVNMNLMFRNCKSLTELDLSSFNTKNVNDMGGMFYGCHNLIELDLSNFYINNETYMYYMFCCNKLEKIKVNKDSVQIFKNKFSMDTFINEKRLFNKQFYI